MNRPSEGTGDGVHVGDQIPDYLLGSLPPEQRTEIMRHLESCESCALDLQWAASLFEGVARRHERHLPPSRLIALSEASPEGQDFPTAATREEQDHLTVCATCRQELSWARDFPALDAMSSSPGLATREEKSWAESAPGSIAEEPSASTLARPPAGRSPAEPSPIGWRRLLAGLRGQRWTWVGIAAAGAAVLLTTLLLQRDDTQTLARLAQIEALPVRIQRAPVTPGTFEEAWVRALETYGSGDYAAAEALFLQAASVAPERPEVHLYLGSARLLLGRAPEAVAALREAVRLTEGELAPEAGNTIGEESRWQLANAYLLLEDASSALPLLQEVARARGRRAPQAEELLLSLP